MRNMLVRALKSNRIIAGLGMVLTTSTAWNGATIAFAQNVPGTVSISYTSNSFFDNNTFSDWLPQSLFSIYVDQGGTVFTAGDEEYGAGCLGIKNGSYVATYANGTEAGYGDFSAQVAADTDNVYRASHNGVLKFPRSGANQPSTVALRGVDASGIALYNGLLYVSDRGGNQIRVLNSSDLSENTGAAFSVNSPGQMAIDSNGRLWVVHLTDSVSGSQGNQAHYDGDSVNSYDLGNSNAAGPSITNLTQVRAVAINGSNQLLLGGRDSGAQVSIYNSDGSFSGTFGNRGGIYSGTPGQAGNLKFHWITGLGVDGSGNIYVGSIYGSGFGLDIQAYNSDGSAKLWEVGGYGFENNSAFDPDNDGEVYDYARHYHLDYSQSNGAEWSLSGLNFDDVDYPNDPRPNDDQNSQFFQGFAVRNLDGKKFLYTIDQNSGAIRIYQFDPSGTGSDVSRQSVSFIPSGNTDLISTYDGSGNATTQTVTSIDDGNGHAGSFAHIEVTSRGDLIRVDAGLNTPHLFLYPYGGLDSNNNPIYNASNVIVYDAPPEFQNDNTDVARVAYDQANDTIYLAAHNSNTDNDGGFSSIISYTNWSGANGTRSLNWNQSVPYDDTSYTPNTNYGGGAPESIKLAGNYLFLNYGYGLIRVLNQSDGSLVGSIFSSQGGNPDADDAEGGLNVIQRSNGEFEILSPNVGRNNDTFVRWNPNN